MKAFPQEGQIEYRLIGNNWVVDKEQGMDLRDYFAAKATERDIEEYQWEVTVNTGHILAKQQIRTREESRYAYADAMMKARSK